MANHSIAHLLNLDEEIPVVASPEAASQPGPSSPPATQQPRRNKKRKRSREPSEPGPNNGELAIYIAAMYFFMHGFSLEICLLQCSYIAILSDLAMCLHCRICLALYFWTSLVAVCKDLAIASCWLDCMYLLLLDFRAAYRLHLHAYLTI